MAKTILIVDDSSSVRQVVGIALKGAGYAVIEACDGRDALAKLTGQKVHLIISDVNMPNMDGITFLKAVKALPAYRFTPVIMLTTESQEAKKREGQLAGAKAWVVKPFQPPTLLGAVEKLVLP
ncbi:response regulator [Cupriavidus plantarum]|uniref:Two-component system chemotaxis response regulator CheY n=1 Tax=Cupriavidus plantarum TaxID=942865 RepID=A0A316EUT6_9BURK|nr:response regulator [Cupriavidus plantarum]NYI00508.1 two-component system chemotaxis response regulator CheY [Cupriavidus plantarum]PWK34918.1 two-component system chemotaxis response regulator CheY [Cupriavidus plantarum]REE93359.1 two-component system chemotaxis response regulator CheY [Cupriavidus plantarum]RLK38791.1 two-component system chemotaxis response regulator CheY [Cupriavidus plantarum]CAG2137214.1 Chemotaxis protein CheY [Cupriavidus plantarum]